MKTSESIDEIAKSLVSFQGCLKNIDKNKRGYNYNYSPIEQIMESIRVNLLENGLCVLQEAQTALDGVTILTRIQHQSGQFFEFGPLSMPVGRKDAHSTGSAITYAKRYALCAALGIVSEDEDDDGLKAQQSAVSQQKKTISVDEWLKQWNKKYDAILLNEFINQRAEYMKHDLQTTVNQLHIAPDVFERKFSIWKKQKEEGEEQK